MHLRVILKSSFNIFNTWMIKIYKYYKYEKHILKSLPNDSKSVFDSDYEKCF